MLMAPQVYWFSLICRGALRLFTGSSRSRRPPVTAKDDLDGQAPSQPANGYSTHATEQKSDSHWEVGGRVRGKEGGDNVPVGEVERERKVVRLWTSMSFARVKKEMLQMVLSLLPESILNTDILLVRIKELKGAFAHLNSTQHRHQKLLFPLMHVENGERLAWKKFRKWEVESVLV